MNGRAGDSSCRDNSPGRLEDRISRNRVRLASSIDLLFRQGMRQWRAPTHDRNPTVSGTAMSNPGGKTEPREVDVPAIGRWARVTVSRYPLLGRLTELPSRQVSGIWLGLDPRESALMLAHCPPLSHRHGMSDRRGSQCGPLLPRGRDSPHPQCQGRREGGPLGCRCSG